MTKSENTSKSEIIGEGQTDKWYIGGCDPNSALTFIFDIGNFLQLKK
jgi:hypothetical protein